jgi:transposase
VEMKKDDEVTRERNWIYLVKTGIVYRDIASWYLVTERHY